MKLLPEIIKITLSLCLVLYTGITEAQDKNISNKDHMTSINNKGVPAPSEYFTGTAWVNSLVPKDETCSYSVANVIFEPGCRNNWHTHPAGQILLITDGKGYYQEKGKPARLLTNGDVVVIPSNVEHWHGASRESSLTHIVITNNTKDGAVKWLAPVTDEEYSASHSELNRKKIKTNISETAVKNHEELWPGYISKAKQTDPELIALFDNFAFDEVISYVNMDIKTRVMMIVASTIASQSLTEYKLFLNAALNIGVTPVEAKEILYQSVPYVGISKVIDFIHATNDVFAERDIKLPLEGQATTTPDTRFENGLALQKEIFGDMIDKMYKDSPPDQLHIQKFLSANCFGDYYTRNGLDVRTRELITYSMLISMGGTENQVKGHIHGNLRAGNSRELLLNVTTQLLPYIGYPRTLNAIKCLNETIE